MIHKNKSTVPAGEITTWLIKGKGTNLFKISVFMMSKEHADARKIRDLVREIEVMIYDGKEMAWKVLIPNGVFSNTEIEAMVEADNVLPEIKDFIKDFFCMEEVW